MVEAWMQYRGDTNAKLTGEKQIPQPNYADDGEYDSDDSDEEEEQEEEHEEENEEEEEFKEYEHQQKKENSQWNTFFTSSSLRSRAHMVMAHNPQHVQLEGNPSSLYTLQ